MQNKDKNDTKRGWGVLGSDCIMSKCFGLLKIEYSHAVVLQNGTSLGGIDDRYYCRALSISSIRTPYKDIEKYSSIFLS